MCCSSLNLIPYVIELLQHAFSIYSLQPWTRLAYCSAGNGLDRLPKCLSGNSAYVRKLLCHYPVLLDVWGVIVSSWSGPTLDKPDLVFYLIRLAVGLLESYPPACNAQLNQERSLGENAYNGLSNSHVLPILLSTESSAYTPNMDGGLTNMKNHGLMKTIDMYCQIIPAQRSKIPYPVNKRFHLSMDLALLSQIGKPSINKILFNMVI